MGKTFSTGLLTNGIWQDASNNVGIGAAPSGTYKLEVTGTAKVSSTLLVSGAATLSSTLQVGGTSSSTLTIGDAVGSAADANLRLRTGSTKYAWLIASQNNVAGFEITPSTAVGGTTFSTPALIILPTGNVGIGVVPTQSAALTFADALGQKILLNNNANNYRIDLVSAVSGGDAMMKFIAGSAGAGEVGFYTTTNLRMLITSGGNVGIGTASPNIIGFTGPMLTIAGTGQGQGVEIWRNSNTIPDGEDLGLITFLAGTSPTQVARIVGKAVGTSEDAGALSFQTSSGAGVTERMRITSGGRVGIGSTNPAYKFVSYTAGNTSSAAAMISADYYGPIIGTVQNSSGYYAFKVVSSLTNPSSDAGGAVDLLTVRADGLIFAPGIYSNTNSNAANVWVNSDGSMYRSTASSIRYKENINDWNGSGLDTILALKPKTFKYKKDYYNLADVDFLGLIAEEVAEVSPYLAEYENQDRTGQVENVRYATIVVPLIAAIQEQQAIITSLQDRLNKAGL